MNDRSALTRTLWAEMHVESLMAPTFIAEFVFRSPQVADRTQKEVADFLVLRGEQALLVSQKCQEDPTNRAGEKLQRWARKRADGALSQLKGALRRVGEGTEIWCQHPRRGRVSFPNGLPAITHAIATVEVLDRVRLSDDLPLEHAGVPISYLSVNDFLNVCQQLRTVPEIVRYLDARRSLPKSVLTSLGVEQLIFSYYLLLDGDMSGFTSLDETERILSIRSAEFFDVITAKVQRDRFAMMLEYVADQLAGRHKQYQDGLSQVVLDKFEPTGERRAYLKMQELIAGVSLGERAEIGRALEEAIRKRREQGDKGLTFVAAMVGSHPECVFVLGSFGETPRFTRNDLLSRFHALTSAAMAHYRRTRCLLIVDRDGQSFEVGLAETSSPPTAQEVEVGRNVFGALKVFEKEIHLRVG